MLLNNKLSRSNFLECQNKWKIITVLSGERATESMRTYSHYLQSFFMSVTRIPFLVNVNKMAGIMHGLVSQLRAVSSFRFDSVHHVTWLNSAQGCCFPLEKYT